MKAALLAAALLCAVCSPAPARPAHLSTKHRDRQIVDRPACSDPVMRPCNVDFFYHQVGRKNRHAHLALQERARRGQIVAHPHGCPARAFCGCGASVRVFGRSIRRLWLARNWFSFPRSRPAPGRVAVRPHHVFVLEEHIRGHIWRVYDANSGHHRTRIHARSIAGWTVVNPHGSRYAAAGWPQ